MNSMPGVFCRTLLLSFFVALTGQAALADTESPAPSTTMSDAQVEALDLDAYKGKAVYLDFWASWCGPCRASFPAMNKMREQYSPESLAIIAVNVDSSFAAAQRFLQKYPANFDIVYDPQGKLATEYEVKGMPSSYLINSAGELVYTHVGFRSKDAKKIQQQIDNLLAEAREEKQGEKSLLVP